MTQTPSGDIPILARARVMQGFAAAADVGRFVVTGPRGAGKGTALRSWSAQTGSPMIWLGETGTLADAPEHPQLLRALQQADGPVVAALRLSEVGAQPIRGDLLGLQKEFPSLVVVAIAGLRAMLSRSEPSHWPTVTGSELSFTRREILDLAAMADVSISMRDVDVLLEYTAGYPLAVADAIALARSQGRFEPETIEASRSALMGALGGLADRGVIPARIWRRMLRTAVPPSLSLRHLAALWGTDNPDAIVRMFASTGLAEVTEGHDSGHRLVLVRGLREALRHRMLLDLTDSDRSAAVRESADLLAAEGAMAAAVELLDSHGQRQDLHRLLAREWTRLAQEPAARTVALLQGVHSADPDPRLSAALARAKMDLLHAGHNGRVTQRMHRRAARLLDRMPRELDDPPVAATVLTCRAILLRVAGDHDAARALHDQARAAIGGGPSAEMAAFVHTHAALTEFECGELDAAARLLAIAGDGHEGALGPHASSVIHELADLLDGYLGRRHAAHEPKAAVVGGDIAKDLRALAESARLLARLEVPRAWAQLDRMRVPVDDQDPVVMLVLRAQAEAMAHILSGAARAGLGALDVTESLLAPRRLTPFEASILRNTRAELLAASGQVAMALDVSDERPQGLVATVVRCVVLLGAGRAPEAAELLGPMLPSPSGWATNYPTWLLVVATLVWAELGQDEVADAHLERGLAIAARSGALLPFARQGPERLAMLVERARGLRLDPASRAVVDRLERSREELRLVALRADLSDRELIVLRHLADASSARRLAASLHVSENTVKSQMRSIYRKLGVNTRQEALRAARILGLVEPETVD